MSEKILVLDKDKEIRHYFNIYSKHISKEKGYGVFTKELIPKDSLIEVCYCVPAIGSLDWNDFVFENSKDSFFLPLGFGCIYNHSFDNNIRWLKTNRDNITVFFSTRDIQPEEELCHNYGKLWWKLRLNNKKLI